MTIKVTDFEFKALSSLAEVTGLTKSQIMRLAVKVSRATLESDNREHPRGRSRSSRESYFRMMDIVDLSLSTRSIRATGPGFTMITMLGNPHQFKLRHKVIY